MKHFLLFLSFFAAAGGAAGNETSKTLEALQQLDSLMPERLWVQEFSIVLNLQDFQEQIKRMMGHRRREKAFFALAESDDYLLRATMSKENIRILDHYQEFEHSPFWKGPDETLKNQSR